MTGIGTKDAGRDLEAVQQTLASAWKARDRAAIEQIIAPDWTAIGPNGLITTREELMAPVFELGIQHIDVLDIDDVRVRVFDDVAVVTGRTHVVGRYAETSYDARLRFTDLFIRRSGRWQAVASHTSMLSSTA